jgi:hypothetical protein
MCVNIQGYVWKGIEWGAYIHNLLEQVAVNHFTFSLFLNQIQNGRAHIVLDLFSHGEHQSAA